MFSTNIHQLEYAMSYAACEKLFKRPARQGKAWGPHERSLDPRRPKYHYRVEQSPGYYDVFLYRTRMARLYAPVVEGGTVIEYRYYNYDDRNTSKQFMSNVLCVARVGAIEDAAGERRAYVIGGGGVEDDHGGVFGLKLAVLPNERVDISRSLMGTSYVVTTSQEDKDRRVYARQRLEPFVDLALLHVTSGEVSSPTGFWPDTYAVRELLQSIYPVAHVLEKEHRLMPTLMHWAQAIAMELDPAGEDFPKLFRSRFTSHVLAKARVMGRTGREVIPQFPLYQDLPPWRNIR